MHIVPSNADLLEFTPLHRLDQPQLLWERTNPFRNYGGRRRVSGGLFRIYKITQEDNGYYNFRKKDKSVVSRIHLNVQGEAGRMKAVFEIVLYTSQYVVINLNVLFDRKDQLLQC